MLLDVHSGRRICLEGRMVTSGMRKEASSSEHEPGGIGSAGVGFSMKSV